ncbi:MAG: AmmeMemoRadiSam system protein B [Pleomorphochaeta sp.]
MRKIHKIEKTIHHDIFYPSDKDLLNKLINDTEEIYKATNKESSKVFLIPHASYEFILPLLVNSFTSMKDDFERILILAPSHLKNINENSNINIFVPEYETIITPLGNLNLDTEFINSYFTSSMKNATYFEEESSFEQLYIMIQHYFKDKKVVPICSIIENSTQSKNFSTFLNKLIDDKTLIIISGNASSYQKNDLSYKKANSLIKSLESGEKLLQLQKQKIIDSCASGIIDSLLKTKIYKNKSFKIQLIEVEKQISKIITNYDIDNKCVYHITAKIKD